MSAKKNQVETVSPTKYAAALKRVAINKKVTLTLNITLSPQMWMSLQTIAMDNRLSLEKSLGKLIECNETILEETDRLFNV